MLSTSARHIVKSDYETLLEWWKWFRFPAPAQEFLPDYGGVMITQGEEECCAGFLYLTSAPKVAWIEWIVSNPKVKDKVLRKKMIDHLLESLEWLAQQNGVEMLFTSVKHPSLVNHLQDNGYMIGTKNTNELIKLIH